MYIKKYPAETMKNETRLSQGKVEINLNQCPV